jgi:hypothetical protein
MAISFIGENKWVTVRDMDMNVRLMTNVQTLRTQPVKNTEMRWTTEATKSEKTRKQRRKKRKRTKSKDIKSLD